MCSAACCWRWATFVSQLQEQVVHLGLAEKVFFVGRHRNIRAILSIVLCVFASFIKGRTAHGITRGNGLR